MSNKRMKELNDLIEDLEVFASIDHRMQVGTALTFLHAVKHIQSHSSTSNREVVVQSGLGVTFVGRNLAYWGNGSAQVSKALQMLEVRPSPHDARAHDLNLTHEGRVFVERLFGPEKPKGVSNDSETHREE